jgi:outer membrane protein assembly factor BamB
MAEHVTTPTPVQDPPAAAGRTPPPRRRGPRRLYFPAAALALPAAVWLAWSVWEWADLGESAFMAFFLGFAVSVLLGALTLTVWYFFLSGLTWRVKFLGVGAVALLAAAFVACVRDWEVTGRMRIILHPRWEPRPADRLAQRLRGQAAEADGLPPVDLTIDPADSFPRFRGLDADGAAHGPALATDWTARPPKRLWRQAVGGGYAGFAVAGNAAVTVEQRGDDEAVVCYDRATGRERWAYSYPAHFRQPPNMGGDGPRATPAVADGDVYALGATGRLARLDGATGAEKWKADILEDNQAKNAQWGMTGSPLVIGDVVIVNPGVDPGQNAGRALAAYDRKTGEVVWAKGTAPASYSSPQAAELAGRPQVLLFDAEGLAGVDPADGTELWRYPCKDLNLAQPLVLAGDRVFISSGTLNGSQLLHVRREGDGYAVEKVWSSRMLSARYSNPVATADAIYGLDNGVLVCLDAATGARRWRGRYYGVGQLLRSGDVLVVGAETGEAALVAARPDGFHELARIEVFEDKTWNTPALAGRQLFLRNHVEAACYELPVAEPAPGAAE